MGSVRFWRRFKIAPGVTLNISKTGFSVSIGPQGAKYTIGTSGSRMTVGVPGTGLHYTHKFGTGSTAQGKASSKAKDDAPTAEAAPPSSEPVTPVLETPWVALSDDEKTEFIDACDAVAAGDEATALAKLQGLVHHADAAFLAGLLRLRNEEAIPTAAAMLRTAYLDRASMGQVFAQCERDLAMDLPITDEVSVKLRPDPLGAALAYVEALQRLDRIDEGVAVLDEMNGQFPDHPLIAMSLEDLKAA